MKVLFIGGNHRRHMYFLNKLEQNHELCGAVIEHRENFIPIPPENALIQDKQNFTRHFSNRESAEKKYFGNIKFSECEKLEVTKETLNSYETASFIKKANPDVVFGSNLIKGNVMDVIPKYTLNMHLGLSPRYRGAATLFWPFYFLEPNFAGSTFHYLVSEPDAGNVVHQTVPELEKNDGIHDVGCKTVVESSKDAIKLLDILQKGEKLNSFKQTSTGKNFLFKDFKPEHLRIIYNMFNDDIVKHYIGGNINPGNPKLSKQFG